MARPGHTNLEDKSFLDEVRTVGMHNPTTFDVVEKVEVLQNICSKERNRYRSKLEIPRVYFRSGATGEMERDNMGTATYHGRSVSRQKTNSVVGGRLRPGKTDTEAPESTKNSIRQDILQKDERRATDFIWKWSWRRS